MAYGDNVNRRASIMDIAMTLKSSSRKLLIEHIDGKRAIRAGEDIAAHGALSRRELIRYEPVNSARPQFSLLTSRGREVVSAMLAKYADTLVGQNEETTTAATMMPPPPLLADD